MMVAVCGKRKAAASTAPLVHFPIEIDPTAGTQKPLPCFADVPRHALRIAQAHAAVELEAAAERGAMLIALLRSGLTGPRKWVAQADGSKTQIAQIGHSAKFGLLHHAAQTAMMRSVEPG
jgi:hypothetical protein